LALEFNEITCEGAVDLSEGIAYLEKLNKLELNLKNNKID